MAYTVLALLRSRTMVDLPILPSQTAEYDDLGHTRRTTPDDGVGGHMMAQQDIALMAHLLRRAGFGATREEVERCVAQGYEATVEELLHPENAPVFEEDVIRRYHVDENSLMLVESCQAYWLYYIRVDDSEQAVAVAEFVSFDTVTS